ncbi:MAG TPA: hypothetical protein VJ885_14125 [Thermoanaerobaculia bacterium]|nr:hypothetical protein [Thermoanaerobaculia bacterium]
MTRRVWLVLCGLLLAARALSATPVLRPEGSWIVLSGLPPLLERAEVRKQLDSGLTATLAFDVRTTGSSPEKIRGGARVDVRYELWDEIYVVTRLDASGKRERLRFDSFEKLGRWWREARLAVLPLPPNVHQGAGQWTSSVWLRVIPFSQTEQRETQRWLTESMSSEGEGSAGAVSQALEDRPASLSQLLQLLVATSIGRPALFGQEWKLPFSTSGGKR